MGYRIDWHTAKVRLTAHARLELTVKVETDLAMPLHVDVAPNPIWCEKFNRRATSRRHEWQARQLHWGTPRVDHDGLITVAPIDSSTTEAEFLRSELDDLVETANEQEGGEWESLKNEAGELTHLFRSGA